MISALVIFKPAGGKPIGGTEAVTSETVRRFLPDPDAAMDAVRWFQEHGFRTGPLVGNSFSVEAEVALFEKIFGGKVRATKKGLFFEKPKTESEKVDKENRQLPKGKLPAAIAGLLDSITFPEPPDFGPSDFGTQHM